MLRGPRIILSPIRLFDGQSKLLDVRGDASGDHRRDRTRRRDVLRPSASDAPTTAPTP